MMKIAAVWLAFVLKKNCDGSPWRPEEGDRVCSDHFISGKKSDSATSPDFVPSIKPKKLKVVGCDERGKASHRRFERARRRARMQEHCRKELEANKEQNWSKHSQRKYGMPWHTTTPTLLRKEQ